MKNKGFIYNLEEVENTNPFGFSTRRILFLYIMDKEKTKKQTTKKGRLR